MEKFKGESIIDFFEKFKTDLDCLEYLASIKWKDGFTCSKCNHDKFTIRKANFARYCNRCHHVESPTANTLFHRVKFGVRKAFGIAFEMSATTKSISASQIAKPHSHIKNNWWNPKWIPITNDGSGNHLCLDLDPADGGFYGQIIQMEHDNTERTVVAFSTEDLFNQYLKALKSGDLFYSDDYGGIVEKWEE